MRRSRAGKIAMFVMFAVVFLAVFSYFVMWLWNWIMPMLFGLRVITFWQAVGILVLSKILFGGFRGGPHRDWNWRRRMYERWGKMTPEEREKLRERMRSRCGPWGAEAAEPKV